MTTPKRLMRSTLRLLTVSALTAFTSIALAGPIGYLQSDGRIKVQPAGANAPVTLSGDDYTVFPDDRIETIQGSAVLVLNGGGVIGLSQGTSARVQQGDTSADLTVALDAGSVVYSIPGDANSLKFDVDNVIFAAVDSATNGPGNLGSGDFAGTLSVNENRQVSAHARSGDIRVLRPNGNGLATTTTAGALVAALPSSTAGQAFAPQQYDTLTNVAQGNAVQVQASGSADVAAVSVLSGSIAQADTASVSDATQLVNGSVGLVGSSQGDTVVVTGGKNDTGIQSVSP